MADNNENKVLNVPHLRFPEFSGEWETKSINDLADVIGGGTPDTTVKSYWDGGIQWFTPSEIGKNKFVDASLRTITEDGLNNSSAKLLPPNTILLSSRATIGECSLSLRECATNQGFQSLVSKKCNVDFLYYLIQTKKKDLIRKSCGSTFLEISANEVRKIQVSVPSDVEQQKIAGLLSLIDKRIATQNKIIEKLETLIKGIRNYVLNNKLQNTTKKKLGELCTITTGKLDANAMKSEGLYPFFTCAEEVYRIDSFAFDTEALLVSGNGANLGYIHYYKGKFNAYQRTYVLSNFIEDIHYIQIYLEAYLHKRIALEKSTSNTPYIVLATLAEMPIIIPNIKIQKDISNKILILKSKLITEIHIRNCYKDMRQFLLSQMFI